VRVLRASLFWLGPGRVLEDVAIEHARGRILRVRRARRAPPRLVLPALVDAHVHLGLAPLARAERRFVPWLRAVIAQRRAEPPGAAPRRALAAIDALLAEGCALVGEIDDAGQTRDALRARPAMGGRCYQELLGFDLGASPARALVAARARPGTRACGAGLSPHAPYSVSPALFAAARATGLPLAIHAAEAPEERELLGTGRGPLRELLEDLGRLPARWRPPGLSPIRWLDRLGVLGPRTTLIHCQDLDAADEDLIARRGCAIVVCPGTIRWFRRTPPPVPRWLARGIPVALGTDSLASNQTLSLRHELRLAARCWPGLAPAQLLAMATGHGGRALRRRHGTCRPGAPAAFASLELPRRASLEEALAACAGDAVLTPLLPAARPRRLRPPGSAHTLAAEAT
jgi:cytosine/adenosine deaminase-related metal-dependent hydrolase